MIVEPCVNGSTTVAVKKVKIVLFVGYETVKTRREHDYESVTKKTSTATDYGYETVENLHRFERIDEDRLNDFDDVNASHRHSSVTSQPQSVTSHHGQPQSVTSHHSAVASHHPSMSSHHSSLHYHGSAVTSHHSPGGQPVTSQHSSIASVTSSRSASMSPKLIPTEPVSIL